MKRNLSVLSILLLLAFVFNINAFAQKKAKVPAKKAPAATAPAKPAAAAPQLGKNSIKEVVKAMTLEEKSKLVVGRGFRMPGMPKPSEKQMKEGIDIGGFKLPPS